MRGTKRGLKVVTVVGVVLTLSSCSYLSTRSVVGGKKDPKVVTTVPKKQYDELLQKYQALLRRNRQLEGEEVPAEVTNAQATKRELPKLAETVDVFAQQLEKAQATKSVKPVIDAEPLSINPVMMKNLDGQIHLLKKAITLINSNHFDNALQALKSLEGSKHGQIRVRVKFYMGEILFRQHEYDLAMQLFEEVIHKYAFSGIVVKTLGRLIVCSEKLKIRKKYDLYYSILHDFFKTA